MVVVVVAVLLFVLWADIGAVAFAEYGGGGRKSTLEAINAATSYCLLFITNRYFSIVAQGVIFPDGVL